MVESGAATKAPRRSAGRADADVPMRPDRGHQLGDAPQLTGDNRKQIALESPYGHSLGKNTGVRAA